MGSACSYSRTAGTPPPPYLTDPASNGAVRNNAGPAPVNRTPLKGTSPTETLSPSEVIQQKAEEFWKEIKDIKIPDVTSGKTSDEVIEDIIEHERVHNGIDWKAAMRGGEKEIKKAIAKAHEHLQTIRNTLSDDNVHMAKSMGLLNEDGNIHHYDLLAEEASKTSPGLAPIPGSAAPYVVWGWNKKQTEKFQTATGGRVKDLIVNLIRNFQVMQNDSTRYLVKTFMEAGLWGLGAYGLMAVWRIVRTLAALSEATEAYAVLEGVMAVGVNVIKLGITIVILAILVPLFIYMTKNAAGVMVIINDTDEDMRLIDLHTTHGKVVGIFKENAALDNPQPIIPKKLPPIFNPKTHKVVAEGSIQAGFFAARKKDAALIGSQGALKFDATSSYPKGVYIGWEVPLSQGKNCVLLSADYTGSTSDFSDKTNSDGTQDISVVSSKNARITAHVNSGSGSQAYYIISITEPTTAAMAETMLGAAGAQVRPLALMQTPKETLSPSEIIQQKAEEFWKEIKDIKIPDVTSGKTSDEVIQDIIEHERVHNGIDWKAAMRGGDKEIKKAIAKAHEHLQTIRNTLSDDDVHMAKSMGLLNEDGNIHHYDLLAEDAAKASPGLAPIPGSAAPYVVWGWNKKQTENFQTATGGRVKDLIVNLIRNFQVMQNDSTRYLVKTFMEAGLWGLGAYGLMAVWRIVRTLAALSEATEAYAVLEGVMAVGVNVIKLGITIVILAILVPLFIYMTKNAAGVMVIINDTNEDMRLIDLHTTHGKVVGIFKENAALDNPQPIIPKKLPPIINPKTHKVVAEGSIQAGFFAARKKDAALIGSQGALKFDATSSYPKGVYIGWEVPLSQGKNCVLLSADYTGSTSDFSDKTSSDGTQDISVVSSKNARITAHVNSGSGSEAYYIISITEPATAQLAMIRSPREPTTEEKASKFWDSMKHIQLPDVTKGKTSDQVMDDIIDHEHVFHGIDWRAAAKEGGRALMQASSKAHARLRTIRKKMSAHEVQKATAMGLLDPNGNVPEYDLLGASTAGEPNLAPIPSGAAPYVCWGWNSDHAAQFQNATGDRIKDLITNMIRNFQVMNDDDVRFMVKSFMEAGLWGLGLYGLKAVWRIVATLSELTEASTAYAVFTGIAEVGVNVIKLGITTVILAVLVPIFIYMTKDAAACMVIINDTDEDLDLSDIHATHGKIVGIFKESAKLDNPKPIVPKKLPPIYNQKGKLVCKGSIQAGFLASRKHDNALIGTQGAFKFAATTSYPKGVSIGWEVPLSQGNNRLLVSASFEGGASQFSDMTNDADKQEDSATSSKNAKVTGRVHSSSGSKGYYIFNITEPTKTLQGGATVADPPTPNLLGAAAPKPQPTDAKSIEERSQKFWNEIKDIEVPDVTEGKSEDELLNDIFEHEKKENGIDWKAAAEAGGDALDGAMKKAHARLKSIREKMDKKDLDTAMSMGLLNSKGEVPEYDLMAKEPDEHPPLLTAMVAGAEPIHTVPIPSQAAPYMVWGWKAEKVKQFQGATGSAIKVLVMQLVRQFQAMKDDKTTTMTKAFTKAGLWGVGAVGLRAVWQIFRAASAITEAVEATAVADGIAAIGASVITLGIATCILAVLVPLFIFMNKNAAAIMVIINDTDEDMSMVDVHATHGKVVGIFKEGASLDNVRVAIPKKLPPIIDPKTKKVVLAGSVQAGFFAAKKRDSALYGTQGGMKFAPTTRFPNGLAVGWEVPLTMGSNRLLVSASFTGSASEFSNETNDHGNQEDHAYSSTHGQTNAQITGRVNSSSGSEAYYIINIE